MNSSLLNETISWYPDRVHLDGLSIDPFPTLHDLFNRISVEVRQAPPNRLKLVGYANVHVANQARRSRALQRFLQQADVVYCDGAGIQMGAKLTGQFIPNRYTAADWLPDLLRHLASAGLRVYFIAGATHLPAKAQAFLDEQVMGHSVVGIHHGYVTEADWPALLDDMALKQPDVLIVGMGSPVQEEWILTHQQSLKSAVPSLRLLYAIGATLDYFVGHVPRCPAWMGRNGLEWLYRLGAEPRRLFGRYVVGNPRFVARVLWGRLRTRKR